MSLIVNLIPGTTWIAGDDVTPAKLNLTANPTITVTGSTTSLSNFSTTPPVGGQYLVWNATTGLWTPATLPVSGSELNNALFAWSHFS